MALTHALSTNNYGSAHLIVATSAANGTHTTLTSAMADAVSGDTIFLRDSVTENVTLTAGVNIAAWIGGTLNTPTITGRLTMTTAGTCNISGIRLQTNSASLLAVTGSAATVVNLENCYLNCTNNTGITYSSSNTSSEINIYNCKGDLGTTGIALFVMSSTGNLTIENSYFFNSGGSTTASTVSAGNLITYTSKLVIVITTSSTGFITAKWCNFEFAGATVLNTNNTSNVNFIGWSNISSGSFTSLSIGAGATTFVYLSEIHSDNTNTITGSGTLAYEGLIFTSTSSGINTTTQIGGLLKGGTAQAPTIGFLGEQIRSTVSVSVPIPLTPSVQANVTSISLTPGIWDVTGIVGFIGDAGTNVVQIVSGISPTSATLLGNYGDDTVTFAIPTGLFGLQNTLTIPALRITISTTTIYYLIAFADFSVNTYSAYGRISATRVA